MNEPRHNRHRTPWRASGKRANAQGARAKHANAQSAFTLVEMLAVIGVIAILFGVAVVGFNHIGRSSRLRTAGRLVGQELDLARQLAMTQRRIYGVEFEPRAEPARDRLRIYYKDTASGGNIITVGKWVELPARIEFGALPPPANVDMPPDQEGIQFRPTGSTVEQVSEFKIHDSDTGRYYEVTVYQVTGHTTVEVPD